MNITHLKERFSLFDKRGLDKNTITNMRLIVVAVMGGVIWTNITTGVAMAGYLKDLQASDFLYGVIFALSPIANAFQFFASYRMERTLKRRRMFLLSGALQRSIWIPFALIPFIIPASDAQLRLAAAVLCVAVSAGMSPFMNVSFYSICADVVPMRIRGRYFATRSRISTCAGLCVGLLVGALLDSLPGFTGYCVVFIIAGVAGVLDVTCFLFMPLPEMQKTDNRPKMLPMLRKVIRDKSYMRIVLSMGLWNFTVQMSSPYFNVYMRDIMGMSNFNIMLYGQIASNLFLILFVNRWGRAMDAYGNKPVLCVAAVLTSIYPFLYINAAPGMLFTMFVANALSGATYCAIDLSAQNLFMGQADGENKSMFFAVYFLFTQLLGLALGSSSGGFLLDNVFSRMESLNIVLGGMRLTRYNYLFAASGLLRFLVAFLMLTRIREPSASTPMEMVRAGFHGFNQKMKRLRGQMQQRSLRKKMKRDIR